MPAALDRLQFAPPPPPGMLRALGFAVIAHLLLMLALGWGVNWKRDVTMSAEAELWSSLPQEAAPKLVEPTPPPPVAVPVPVPVPPPPVVKSEAPKPEPVPREAEIAIEREKEKKAEEKRKQLALEREKKRDAEKQKQLEAKRELEERRKQELAKAKAAEDKKKLETAKAQKAIEAQRQANIERMKGMAGATGAAAATGTALRSSGPSDSYAGRIAARIKSNIIFAETVSGNPVAVVRIRVAPDGTIVGKTLQQSSGIKSWDEAVLRAIDKTAVLPRDTDGRVVPEFPVSFKPND